MLTAVQALFASLAIGISIFMIFTDHYDYQNCGFIILISLLLVMGMSEFKAKRKLTGGLSIVTAGLMLVVVIRDLFFF